MWVNSHKEFCEKVINILKNGLTAEFEELLICEAANNDWHAKVRSIEDFIVSS